MNSIIRETVDKIEDMLNKYVDEVYGDDHTNFRPSCPSKIDLDRKRSLHPKFIESSKIFRDLHMNLNDVTGRPSKKGGKFKL